MSEEKRWSPIESAPEGILVWTKIHDKDGERNEQLLLKRNNLWWAGDMYVYYAPTHWRFQP